jgi:hypothetical protein
LNGLKFVERILTFNVEGLLTKTNVKGVALKKVISNSVSIEEDRRCGLVIRLPGYRS